MNYKGLASAFLVLTSAAAFAVPTTAYEKSHSESYYNEVFRLNEKTNEVEVGDRFYTWFNDALPHIQANDNQIFYIFAQFTDKNGNYSENGTLEVELHTSDRKTYAAKIDLSDGNFFTAKEIVELSEIPDYTKVEAVTVSFPDNCMNRYFRCAPMEKGWNTIDNVDYYVKSDGEMITKSCKIGGVRYKFTSDGVCQGKYTGWTKSASGKRYYKDGVLIANKKLKTSDGIYYFADDKGYVTKVN